MVESHHTPKVIHNEFLTQICQTSSNNNLEFLLEELDLPLRLVNSLKKAGYKKVGDFVGVKKDKIREVKNVGEKSLAELEKVLREKGVVLEE